MEISFSTPVKAPSGSASLYASPHSWASTSPLTRNANSLTDRYSPGEGVFGCGAGMPLFGAATVAAGGGTASGGHAFPCALAQADRFISTRESQDASLSHYLLTSKENATPANMLPSSLHGSPMRSSVSQSSPYSPPGRAGAFTPSRSYASPSTRASSISDVFTKLNLEGSTLRETSNSPTNGNGGDSPLQQPLPGGAVMEAEPYTTKLARTLFSAAPRQTSVLGLHSEGPEAPAPSLGEAYDRSLGVVYEGNRARNFRSKTFRMIAQTPERILDAADMVDDFYLNLIDWSSSDILAVALQSTVYLWDAATCNITQLPSTRPADATYSNVCCVNWAGDGQHLAVGLNDGSVEVWDAETQTVVRNWFHHSQRVSSISWSSGSGSQLLASGSKDASIRIQDLRERPPMTVLRAHAQEVCGLRWAPGGVQLASGGNDNQLLLWDRRRFAQGGTAAPSLFLNQHTAAVKALAWNPAQPALLASGGGTEDKTLRFWNTTTGECVHSINTQSQVCGVLWNLAGTELVSSHGFSMNQLTLWKYPSLRRVADLTGHTSRVLHLCLSADGEVVVSAAGDETIRFWRCFPPQQEREASPLLHHSYSALSSPLGAASPVLSPPPPFAGPASSSATRGGRRAGSWASQNSYHADPQVNGELSLR